MPIYRLWADDASVTHIEPLAAEQFAFENGPGAFKGIGGTILGAASRVMLMRFERRVRPQLHRANPGFAVLLEGELVVAVSDGTEVALHPGDAVRIESTGDGWQGGWAPCNPGPGMALLAITQMPAQMPPPRPEPPAGG